MCICTDYKSLFFFLLFNNRRYRCKYHGNAMRCGGLTIIFLPYSFTSQSMGGGEQVTKKDLIAQVAGAADLSKKQAGIAVDAFLEGIKGSLNGGDKVSLVGFGTFSVKNRKARTGINPSTGQKMNYPAKKVPHFKAGKGLKDSV